MDLDDELALRRRYTVIAAIPEGCDDWHSVGGGWDACGREGCGWHRVRGSAGRYGLHPANGREGPAEGGCHA